ncbi:MAG: hypothetical protein P857_1048 [Candidatus Xenolissoclinum pacificiensis L6]|uniref:Uncharacterized protein n=1 Tax=Candidatus Xenolissoclinum pacificiensis L6 TaxID=1401685 RepID=W2V0T1_9RICK|nr:MAG: hypothetical protein P857_1048 [Candidatus Xenolissoclinum pacificiensis L6]
MSIISNKINTNDMLLCVRYNNIINMKRAYALAQSFLDM